MASKQRKRHRSYVGDVIKFDPEENPPWKDGQTVPPVGDMIRDIVGFQNEWESMKGNCDASAVQREFLERFVYHCNKEERHGCGTLEKTRECLASEHEVDHYKLSTKQKETRDLKEAYEYLLDKKTQETDLKCHGCIEESMLRGAHEIILKTVSTRKTRSGFTATAPGHYSDKERHTIYNREVYYYQQPEDMHLAVCNFLDKFNSLFAEIQHHSPIMPVDLESGDDTHSSLESQTDDFEDDKRLLKLYKACSWLLFELLDLHPFGDGNGRLCRLLCSYVLSTCTPFPTPIYNIWSTSSKKHYLEALYQTRKYDPHHHPKALATMIIECSWYGWKKFLDRVKTLNEGHAKPRPT